MSYSFKESSLSIYLSSGPWTRTLYILTCEIIRMFDMTFFQADTSTSTQLLSGHRRTETTSAYNTYIFK